MNRLLDARASGEPSTGSAQLIGDSLLLVRAPDSYQSGVAQMIREIAQQKSTPRSVIHIDYWMMIGEQSDSSNAESFGRLSTALNSINKLDGSRKFKMAEHLSSNALSGQEIELKGPIATSKTVSSIADGRILLQIYIQSRFGEVRSATQMNPDEFMVIGENSFVRKEDKDAEPDSRSNVYHIMHVELINKN